MITTEQEAELVALLDKAMILKREKEAAEQAFNMCKSEMETLCDEYGIDVVDSGVNQLEIKHQKRFKKYKDDKAVLDLLPKGINILNVMKLDRTSINKLINDGTLPKEIKDLETYTETDAYYFKEV